MNYNEKKKYFLEKFERKWITDGADRGMVDFALECGRFLAVDCKKGENISNSDYKLDNKNILTRSQFRNIYSEIKRIQECGFDKEKPAFYLLRAKVAYAYGRTDKKKREGIELFKEIFDKAHGEVNNEKQYKNFCDFMEALLAYHRSFEN